MLKILNKYIHTKKIILCTFIFYVKLSSHLHKHGSNPEDEEDIWVKPEPCLAGSESQHCNWFDKWMGTNSLCTLNLLHFVPQQQAEQSCRDHQTLGGCVLSFLNGCEQTEHWICCHGDSTFGWSQHPVRQDPLLLWHIRHVLLSLCGCLENTK